MVGVASSVILCAIFLYVADVRDRCRHERMLQDRHHRRRLQNGSSSKQMGETIASSGGWGAGPGGAVRPYLLPPMNRGEGDNDERGQPEFVEDISISPVSTMTASLAGLRLADSLEEGLETSMEITELSDAHRVTQHTDLASFFDLSTIQTMGPFDDDEEAGFTSEQKSKKSDYSVQQYRSRSIEAFESEIGTPGHSSVMEDIDDYEEDESGWTSSPGGSSHASSEVSIGTYLKSIHSSKSHDGSSTTKSTSSTDSPELLGERCLEVTPQKKNHTIDDNSDATSLDRSPDTPHEGSDPQDAITRNELAQLEQLYTEDSDATSVDRSPDTPREEGSDPEQNPARIDLLAQLEQFFCHKSQLPFQDYAINLKAQDEDDYDEEEDGDEDESEDVSRTLPFEEYAIGAKAPDEDDKADEKEHDSEEEGDDDSTSTTQDYVRTVYFVPVAPTTCVDLGLELGDATGSTSYPMVRAVREDSPLVDRIFVGDWILAVNNEEIAGLEASNVTKRFLPREKGTTAAADIVKLTIMSSQADGSESSSSSSSEEDSSSNAGCSRRASMDTGCSKMAAERLEL
jgi:hypothetical protein